MNVVEDSIMNATNATSLQELNAERRALLMPVTSVLVFIMAAGVVGNLFVVCIYGRKYHRTSAILFMIALGLTHLISSVLLVPFEIYSLTNPHLNQVLILCNICRFLEIFASTFTVLILVCLTVDRFLSTCQTFQLMSMKKAKTLLIVMAFLALSLTWPRLNLNNMQAGLHGTQRHCDVAYLMHGTIYSLLFQGVLCVVFSMCFFVLLMMYTLTAITWCRRRTSNSNNKSNGPLSPMRRKKFEQMLITRALESMNTTLFKGTNGTRKIRLVPGRLTMIIFVVTFCTVSSYLPYISVQFLHYTGQDFNTSSTSTLIYQFCSYSYLLHNAVNPLIYYILDRSFRQESFKCLKKVFQTCKPEDNEAVHF